MGSTNGRTAKVKSSTLIGALILAAAGAYGLEMPLEKVVLFRSGVGYFEFGGVVDGNGEAALEVRSRDVSDVLKSLVVIDPEEGSSAVITCPTRLPATMELKDLGMPLEDNPSLAKILNRLRGEPVVVATASQSITGRVVGVEKRRLKTDDEVVLQQWLNLLVGGRLVQVGLEEVTSLQFLDQGVRSGLERGMSVLENRRRRGCKVVRVAFEGKGRRTVRLGYIRAVPVWRVSYRMMLDGGKTRLEGWAHVQNTGLTDWSNVTLQLVSGRPLAFIENLYDPLFIQRPVVKEDLLEGVIPPEYGQAPLGGGAAGGKKGRGGMLKRRERKYFDKAAAMTRAVVPAEEMASEDVFMQAAPQVQARAERVGESFVYVVTHPVSVPRNSAAMVPIVDQRATVERCSIFNAGVNARYPLDAVIFTNVAGEFLIHGPVTVFDGGVYAGDGRLADAPAGERVIVSYAVDLSCEVKAEEKPVPEEIVSMSIRHGTLDLRRRYVRETEYTARNKREVPRRLIIEHPIHPGWDLARDSRPLEKTRDVYRFAVDIAAHAVAGLTVREERLQDEEVVLSSLSPDGIVLYLKRKEISGEVRAALEEVEGRQREIAELEAKLRDIEAETGRITADQNRIRRNMQTVGRGSEAYNRWLRKLDRQEDRLENLDLDGKRTRAELAAKRKDLEMFFDGLDISQ